MSKAVSEFTDDEFDRLVNDDVRGTALPWLAEQLRTPELADRWYEALLNLKKSLEVQLTADRAERSEKQSEFIKLGELGKPKWFAYRAARDSWRAGAVRLKNGVETRLREAKKLRAEHRSSQYTKLVTNERDFAWHSLERMRHVILAHKEHECTDECDIQGCVADLTLWSTLSENWLQKQ